jgi:hypothetical protein
MQTAVRSVFPRLLAPLCLLAVLAIVWPARADPAAESRAAIERQLDAMAAGDFDGAYAIASPGVQAAFPSVEIFEHMVRNGYPMVVAPRARTFLGAEQRGGVLVQRLRLVDRAGQGWVARYFMQEIDGVWRIAGVEIEPAPDLAV